MDECHRRFPPLFNQRHQRQFVPVPIQLLNGAGLWMEQCEGIYGRHRQDRLVLECFQCRLWLPKNLSGGPGQRELGQQQWDTNCTSCSSISGSFNAWRWHRAEPPAVGLLLFMEYGGWPALHSQYGIKTWIF